MCHNAHSPEAASFTLFGSSVHSPPKYDVRIKGGKRDINVKNVSKLGNNYGMEYDYYSDFSLRFVDNSRFIPDIEDSNYIDPQGRVFSGDEKSKYRRL